MPQVTLDLVTPEKLVLRREVDQACIPGILGEFGILAEHTPFVSILGVGTLTLFEGNKKEKFVINGGFAEVSRDRIIILTETCEAAQKLDLDRAKKALAESSKAILELDANSQEYQNQWQRAQRARARVEVAQSADL